MLGRRMHSGRTSQERVMLIVADPNMWSLDPRSGGATYGVPLAAGTTRAVLTIDAGEGGPAILPALRSDGLVGEPVARRLATTVVVECALSCKSRTSLTVDLGARPARMAVRLFEAEHGIVAWRGVLPGALAHPAPARATFSAFDFVAVEGMLQRNEVDKVIDEFTAVWPETSPSQKVAATVMLFEYLAEHPLKRAVVLGALVASLCDFQAAT